MDERAVNEASWEIRLENELKLRGYSPKTIGAYKYHIRKYLGYGKTPKEFLLGLIDGRKSDETVRLACFAIKFFLRLDKQHDEGIEEIISGIPNVKREKRLPVVLSRNEIEKMILSTKNLNHRLIIMVAYSAGLRLSEIINLRWEDIDFERDIIHIKRAKGKKDRVVMLSPKVKKALKHLTIDREGYVFKTTRLGKYTERTIEMVMKNSAGKAGINKNVTTHTLRHSFATHLLEHGIDIRYIRDLLGHSSIGTTLVYTKVSKRDLLRIKSPLDI